MLFPEYRIDRSNPRDILILSSGCAGLGEDIVCRIVARDDYAPDLFPFLPIVCLYYVEGIPLGIGSGRVIPPPTSDRYPADEVIPFASRKEALDYVARIYS
jgi:hypothetical protein